MQTHLNDAGLQANDAVQVQATHIHRLQPPVIHAVDVPSAYAHSQAASLAVAKAKSQNACWLLPE